MARFLWVVQYFVANGFYVVVDYHPEPGNTEPVTDSVGVYTNNWLMLWAGLTCLPNYEEELRGRVFLDLMNGEARMHWQRSGQQCGPDEQRQPQQDRLVVGSFTTAFLDFNVEAAEQQPSRRAHAAA